MSSINNFFNDFVNGAKTIGNFIIATDRSNESYVVENSDLNKVNESQLKGRAKQITHHFFPAIMGIVFGTLMMMGHDPGIGGYILGGSLVFAGLVHLKEVALQSVAREREKRAFNLEDNEFTTYSLQEAMEDIGNELKVMGERIFGSSHTEENS